jgi:hypothetical protein
MIHAVKLATLIAETEALGSKGREVPPFVGSRTPSERLQLADARVLDRFNSDSGFGVRRRVQSPDTDRLKPSKPAGATTSEVSFGPFRLDVSSAGRRQTSAPRESRHAYTHYLA